MSDAKKIEKYKNLLLDAPGVTKAVYTKSIQSSVTTSWGVAWNADYIARDVIQNFRDANKTEIESIKIETKNDQIVVSAKNTFDLRKLLFLGSNKSGDDTMVGQFGEGFKAAQISMIKLGINETISTSGDQGVVITVGPEVVEDMRPLVYHFFKINKRNQTQFIVNTYNKDLKKAFDFGLNHFWYEKNSLISDLLHEYNDISIYKSTKPKEGFLFYRGILRAKIPHIPVVINISKKYAKIENKIKTDRDRNSFDSTLTNNFLSIWAGSGFYYHGMKNNPAIKYILEKSKPIWKSGHPLLNALASRAYHLRDDKSILKMFGKKYYAESNYYHSRSISWSDWYDKKTQTYIIRRDRQFEKQGRCKLPSYFVRFGVLSSLEVFVKNKEALEKRLKTKKTGALNPKQKKALNFAMECITKVAPGFSSLYKNLKEEDGIFELNVKTCESKDILGELKSTRDCSDKTIYLNKDLFSSNFPKFFSILTHEMSHVFGADGEREFSDVLTHLLEQAVARNAVLSKYSKQWSRYKV